MKKMISDVKGCIISMLSLIIICEILLNSNNRIIQSIGICMTPFIAISVFYLIKNDKKKFNK